MPCLAHLHVLCKGGNSCCRRRGFHLDLAPLINPYRTLIPKSITPIAAPGDEVQLIRPVIAPGMVGHRASLLPSANKSCDVRPCGSHLYKERKGGPATRPPSGLNRTRWPGPPAWCAPRLGCTMSRAVESLRLAIQWRTDNHG